MLDSPYRQSPFIVIWETTRACDLVCKHCRASAIHSRNPLELSTQEALRMIDDIADHMDPQPNLVLSGGDPMKRPDLVDIIQYAAQVKHLRISITPSATPLVTPQAIRACVNAGLTRWAFSIDGATAKVHDSFRGWQGSFDLTMNAVADLQSLGMPLQVNTTVSRYNQKTLADIGALVERLGAVLWSVFFLVAVGRGRAEDALDPYETEEVLQWLYEFSQTSRCDVKTTEAPMWHRIRAQHSRAQGSPLPARLASDPVGRAPRSVSDGDGFIFVGHKGEVYPSGFLPIEVGNIRKTPLSELYRTAPALIALRDRANLKGKCRMCEFRDVCGGSRARAYAITGDAFESDPYCAYLPSPAEGRKRIKADVREHRSVMASLAEQAAVT